MMLLREFQVQECRLTDLIRLCKWLDMPEGSDNQRRSLVNWLIYAGYVQDKYGKYSFMYG